MTETPDDHPTADLPPRPPAQQDVFAAQPRAPRVPWLNPARRRSIGLVAAAAAVVLFGAGFGVGWASSGGGGGHSGPRGWMRDMPGPGYLQPYEGGGRRDLLPRHRHRPAQPKQSGPASSATATPNPTKTG